MKTENDAFEICRKHYPNTVKCEQEISEHFLKQGMDSSLSWELSRSIIKKNFAEIRKGDPEYKKWWTIGVGKGWI